MNGVLMSEGIDAVSIPAARAQGAREDWLQNYHGRPEGDQGFSSEQDHNIEKKQEDTLEKPRSSRDAEVADEPVD